MKTFDLAGLLRSNSYPGRGILLGKSPNGKCAVIAYFIMGRSENSRNRVFVATKDGIRTQAFDPSKMMDPSLIIYAPVRGYEGQTIVTNGDQTDTIYNGLKEGHCMHRALLTRTFEPDAPNYTPRISGLVQPDGSYTLSILKSMGGDPACCLRQFFQYDTPAAGLGHLIHTYSGDGNPLPSFEGEPETVAIPADTPAELGKLLWENLNTENKVSLFVRYLDLTDGKAESLIYNKHAEA